MSNIIFEKVTSDSEIDLLRDCESTFAGFWYGYDQGTIDLLKRNLGRDDSHYLIARQDNIFAAFVATDTDWWEPGCYFLREIFVKPDFQGHWLGKRLMQECIDHAGNNNAKTMVTETAFENIPMQKLCESLGFKKWDNPEWKEGITYKLDLH